MPPMYNTMHCSYTLQTITFCRDSCLYPWPLSWQFAAHHRRHGKGDACCCCGAAAACAAWGGTSSICITHRFAAEAWQHDLTK